jgi:hypothetical protein
MLDSVKIDAKTAAVINKKNGKGKELYDFKTDFLKK